MTTGCAYLGAMGTFGSYEVVNAIISKKFTFKQIAGCLAANVPKRVNAVSSIVFCSATTYTISAIARGRRDNWNYLPCVGFISGWSAHRLGTILNLSPKLPLVLMATSFGALVSLPFICYNERYSVGYIKHKVFRFFNL